MTTPTPEPAGLDEQQAVLDAAMAIADPVERTLALMNVYGLLPLAGPLQTTARTLLTELADERARSLNDPQQADSARAILRNWIRLHTERPLTDGISLESMLAASTAHLAYYRAAAVPPTLDDEEK